MSKNSTRANRPLAEQAIFDKAAARFYLHRHFYDLFFLFDAQEETRTWYSSLEYAKKALLAARKKYRHQLRKASVE